MLVITTTLLAADPSDPARSVILGRVQKAAKGPRSRFLRARVRETMNMEGTPVLVFLVSALSIDAVSAPIHGVQFVVCTDGVGCTTSAYYDSPAS
ncbi:hypothetical protein [Intrasporangium sp. DVR]|uniref:hypothetical protein n=1 Tax=Intrasporangium sp. DVR TaxID=3127867 RepID=UPI00313A74AC